MDKENVVYTHTGVLVRHKENEILGIFFPATTLMEVDLMEVEDIM
jgi:hypothetical protein